MYREVAMKSCGADTLVPPSKKSQIKAGKTRIKELKKRVASSRDLVDRVESYQRCNELNWENKDKLIGQILYNIYRDEREIEEIKAHIKKL